MAYTVQAAFDQFFDGINLSGDHREVANGRRDHILSILRDKLTVNEAFATGSIPRFTALRARADLDVMVALHYGNHIKGRRPSEVLQVVRDALSDYRTNVRKNGQAVTLYYKTWPNVDVTPAVQITDSTGEVVRYEIPDMNREVWLSSNPKRHSAAIEQRSSTCGPYFRKLIKMMKHWSVGHGDYLQSFHIEIAALNALSPPLTDITWEMYQYFDKASTSLASLLWHDGVQVDDYLTSTERLEIQKRVAYARDKALPAWHATYGSNGDHKTAIETWRHVLGDPFPTYG